MPDFHAQIDAAVASDAGCMVIATDDGVRSFAYTVGLISHGFPELIIVGMGGRNAHGVLMEAVFDLQKTQKVPNVGDRPRYGQDISGHSPEMAIGSVGQWAIDGYLCQAKFYAERKGILITGRQLIMPDRAGKLPNDEGYDRGYMDPFQIPMSENRQWDAGL